MTFTCISVGAGMAGDMSHGQCLLSRHIWDLIYMRIVIIPSSVPWERYSPTFVHNKFVISLWQEHAFYVFLPILMYHIYAVGNPSPWKRTQHLTSYQ